MAEQIVSLLKLDIDNSQVLKKQGDVLKQISALKKENQQLKKSTDGLTKANSDQAQKYAQNEASIKKLNGESRTYKKILEDNIKAQEREQKIVVKTDGSINSLRNALNVNKTTYKNLTAEQRKNDQIGGKLLKTIKQQDSEYKKLSSTIGNNQSNVGNYGIAVKKLAGQLGIFASAASAFRVLKDSVKTVKDFELGVAKLASVLGTTPEKVQALTDDAKRLGESTIFAASQVSELQTEFAKLGFKEDQILNATEATLNLAAATGSELSEAAAIAGATLGGFGLDASETGRLTDVMAKSFSASALDLEKFKESMKTAAPAAKAVGVSVEETTALLGTLANSGINGSNAGTALKKTFIELNAQGITMNDAFNQVSNSSDKLATAVDLVGKLAAPSFLVLAEGTKNTAELTDALNDANGAAETMAETQQNTLSGALQSLSSKWEAYVLGLNDATNSGNILTSGIRFLGDNLKSILNTLGFAVAGFVAYKTAIITANVVQKIATGVTTAYRIAVVALNGGFKKAIRGIKAFKVALAGTGIGLLVVGVATLITNLSSLTGKLTETEKAQKRLNKAQKEAELSIAAEKSELEKLLSVAKDENRSKKDRESVIKKLNEISPEYLGNLTLETINTNNGTIAIDKYVSALEKKAKATALNNELVRIEEDIIKNKNKSLDEQVGFFEKSFVAIKSIASNPLDLQKQVLSTSKGLANVAVKNMKEEAKSLNAQKAAILAEINKESTEDIINTSSSSSSSAGGNKPRKDNSKEQLKSKEQLVKDSISLLNAELKIFQQTNQSKLDGVKVLTQKIVDEEKARLKSIFDEEKRIAEESNTLEIQSLQNKLKTKEISQKEFDSRLKVIDAEFKASQLTAQNELNTEILAVDQALADNKQAIKDKEKQDEEKAKQERITKAQEEKDRQLIEAESDAERQLLELEFKYQKEIEYANKIGADTTKIEEKYAAKQKEINKALQNSKLAAAQQIAGTLKGLFDENTVAYKVASIAEASIATYLAANKALATVPAPLNVPAAAATVAAGLVNVSKIAGFAEGSESIAPVGGEYQVADLSSHTGIISGTPNISRANGDNMLATVKTGEAILNQKQQSKLNSMMGFDAVRYAVKGYADGTTFTSPTVSNSIASNVIRDTASGLVNPVNESVQYVVDVKDIDSNVSSYQTKVEDASI